MTEKLLHSPLKWVGGKRALLGALLDRVPKSFRTYREPFVGGGALFWELQRLERLGTGSYGPVLSDSNPHLIEFYRTVQGDVERLIREVEGLKYDRDLYYQIRERLNAGEGDKYERAAWFLLINKCGYNGLWRVNRKGECNVPFGAYSDPRILDRDNLRACHKALQGVLLLRLDFAAALDEAGEGDFVYCDPPYVPLSATASFTSYEAGGFNHAMQVLLRDKAAQASRRGARVLLSNSSAPAVLDLYRESDGWQVEHVEARRSVSCRGNGRGGVKEVLIMRRTRMVSYEF